ncbi:MAG: efflux RND transporter periplasmic adaptor subunit [Deltaproteobacteria bacterium]|nr:efflux RND transporter periplasmic adaptor subunit [Deltaproteobacteria bacterium]
MTEPSELQFDPAPRRIRRIVVPIAIVLAGLAFVVILAKSRKQPKREEHKFLGRLVEVINTSWQSRVVQVASNGVIQPRQQVALAPQVGGRVVWVSDQLVVGGQAKAGQPLLRIDALDYQLAAKRADAAVAQAKQKLAEVESLARVARKEWKTLGSHDKRQATPLALYEPQLAAAQAMVASAEAEAALARANVGRTTIRAPFNLRIRQKAVDIGQFVRVGQTVAQVYGTDDAEVIVSLPSSELRWLYERVSEPEKRQVIVRLRDSTTSYERKGFLTRSVGEVDATGRMSRVVVSLPDPYNLSSPSETYRRPFEIGAFVDVVIPGRRLNRVIVLPTEALRIGDVVWIADKDDRLRIVPVSVARRTAEDVLITSGLEPGQRIVISPLAGAVNGLQLRIKQPKSTKGAQSEHAVRSDS